jgi:hypothetical protein
MEIKTNYFMILIFANCGFLAFLAFFWVFFGAFWACFFIAFLENFGLKKVRVKISTSKLWAKGWK